MKSKEKQRHKLVASKKNTVVSSSNDEDSDVEKNFALLSKRGKAGLETGELKHQGEEEYGGSDDEEEVEQASEGRDGDSDDDDVEEEDALFVQEQESKNSEPFGENMTDDDEDGGDDDDDDDDDEDDEDEDLDNVGGSSGMQTKEEIRKELSNMPFEDIMKLQNKVGTKVYNQVAYGNKKSRDVSKKKRLNKNRPIEISAKKAAPFIRQVVPIRKTAMRDPRFDDLSGEYKPEIFEKTYKFINDIKHKEKEIIQKKLKKTKTSSQRKMEMEFLLKRMENQERARLNREQQREREMQFKRQQREQTQKGDHPVFLKKSDKKKLQLAEKYLELKKSGKLENFLSKKRKRNAVKDRKKLPPKLHFQKTP